MIKRDPTHARPAASKPLSRRALLRAELAALGVCWLGADRAWASGSAGFIVIVNAENPVTAAPRALLSRFFLKQTTRWDDGELVRPVDSSPGSAVRRAFSDEVLGRSVSAVRHYWQQRIFSGRDVPPPELESEEAVLRYVARYRGAVGYVSATAKLVGLKRLSVR